MSTPRITLAMLKDACTDQRAIFRKEWPHGADVTLENVFRAVELGLDLEWGTQWFTGDALEEYHRQLAPLRAEFYRQIVPLRREYQRQEAPLWAEYDRKKEQLWDEYQRQIAPLWVEAFLKSQGGTE